MQLRSSGSSPSEPISAWLTMRLPSDSDEFPNLNHAKPGLPHKTLSSHGNHIVIRSFPDGLKDNSFMLPQAFTEETSSESHLLQWQLSSEEGLEGLRGLSSPHTS